MFQSLNTLSYWDYLWTVKFSVHTDEREVGVGSSAGEQCCRDKVLTGTAAPIPIFFTVLIWDCLRYLHVKCFHVEVKKTVWSLLNADVPPSVCSSSSSLPVVCIQCWRWSSGERLWALKWRSEIKPWFRQTEVRDKSVYVVRLWSKQKH